MKKKLLIIFGRNITINNYRKYGIEFFKNKFNTTILDVSYLTEPDAPFYKNYGFKKIKTLKKLDQIFYENKYLLCLDFLNASYNAHLIRIKIKEHNIKRVSTLGLSGYPYIYKKKKLIEQIKKKLKLLATPNYIIKKTKIYLEERTRKFFYKPEIVVFGGTKSINYPGYSSAKYKIYASSYDYGTYLKKKLNKKCSFKKKNYAVFIDTYFPYHPEHKINTNAFIDAKRYFRQLTNFFDLFEQQTNMEMVVALYPRADLKKYPKNFKKFKIIENDTVNLIKSSKIVFTHGSSAKNFAVMYKKPIIYLTTNLIENLKYMYDHTYERYLLKSKIINIENINKNHLLDKKKIFNYDKKRYESYFNKYIKHPKATEKPWYEVFYNYINKKSNLFLKK